jgi:hypothetical protein
MGDPWLWMLLTIGFMAWGLWVVNRTINRLRDGDE